MPRLERIVFFVTYAFVVAVVCFICNRVYLQYKPVQDVGVTRRRSNSLDMLYTETTSNTHEYWGEQSSEFQSNDTSWYPDTHEHVDKTTATEINHPQLQQWLQSMEVIQNQRQDNLRWACRRYANQTFMNLEEFASDKSNLQSFIYNDEHKVIYNFVHKVASQHLVTLINGDTTYHHNRLYRLRKKGVLSRLRNYKKFIFVRDPLARFVSVYRNKFVEHPNEPHFQAVAKHIVRLRVDKSNQDTTPTFSEFIDYLTGYDKSRRANTHWSSYLARNKVCLLKHDFIGKLESMDDDFTYFFKHILQADDIEISGARTNTTTGQKRLLKDMYSTVSRKSLQKLLGYYESDFRVLGYNFSMANSLIQSTK